MKNKTINITKNQGEINFNNEFHHIFNGGKKTNIDSKPNEYYYLDIHFLQEKTNSAFRVEKIFESQKDAEKYLDNFIKNNPTSEAIIKRIIEKELVHYV